MFWHLILTIENFDTCIIIIPTILLKDTESKKQKKFRKGYEYDAKYIFRHVGMWRKIGKIVKEKRGKFMNDRACFSNLILPMRIFFWKFK